ncbi:helix-turn-helix domain-containing protein [Uliginosibacterium sp. 31-16]|uniref:helix-turn-helix transcriptional regulator n=1 Tax=Uliginosibacterium sp. 31-16 TaxID=3068315 RepID=UPI00273FEFAB|nr:helix-turn-helix domain-containing protein [Uliginosibacterium sp. 31-16]MDP5239105.1 helix-turn-helix domain-containing protein [Uliginosibacterium sp. 31-16]
MGIFAKSDLLDTKEAAVFLGLTVSTLESWRLKGCGPSYKKIGRLVRYSEADLRAYIDSCSRQSTSEYLTKTSEPSTRAVPSKASTSPRKDSTTDDPNKPRRGRPRSKPSSPEQVEPCSQDTVPSGLPIKPEPSSPAIANERSQPQPEAKSPAAMQNPVRTSRLMIIKPDMTQVALIGKQRAFQSAAKAKPRTVKPGGPQNQLPSKKGDSGADEQ